MAMTIGIGYYGWKDDMNITFISYWGMLSFVNGMFDIIRLIDMCVSSPVPVLSSELPAEVRFANLIMIITPLVELIGVPLSCSLYSDYMGAVLIIEPIGQGEWNGAGAGANNQQRGRAAGGALPGNNNNNNNAAPFTRGEGDRLPGPGAIGNGAMLSGSSYNQRSFRAFEGQGHRLDPDQKADAR